MGRLVLVGLEPLATPLPLDPVAVAVAARDTDDCTLLAAALRTPEPTAAAAELVAAIPVAVTPVAASPVPVTTTCLAARFTDEGVEAAAEERTRLPAGVAALR